MTVRTAQELATALVVGNSPIIRCSYVMDDHFDAFNNGVASLVESAVQVAYEFTGPEAREFMRTLVREL